MIWLCLQSGTRVLNYNPLVIYTLTLHIKPDNLLMWSPSMILFQWYITSLSLSLRCWSYQLLRLILGRHEPIPTGPIEELHASPYNVLNEFVHNIHPVLETGTKHTGLADCHLPPIMYWKISTYNINKRNIIVVITHSLIPSKLSHQWQKVESDLKCKVVHTINFMWSQ